MEDIQEFNLKVNTNADGVTEKFTTLKRQVVEANIAFQKASETYGEYSAQAIKAAKAVAELKDKVGDAKAQVDAFKPGGGFKALAGVGQVAASGFAAATGAMTLFGVESQSTEKALLKVQAAMALAQGLGALADAGDAFKNLGAVIKANGVIMGIWNFITTGTIAAKQTLAVVTAEETAVVIAETVATTAQAEATVVATVSTEANVVATEAQVVATEGATVASIGLRAALAAIGIGLIISAIAYLVSNFKDIKKYVTELFPSLNTFGESFDNLKEKAVGVGSVIVNFLISPFKALGKILDGDFKGAIAEFGKGLNVMGNYESGAAKQRASNAKNASNDAIEKLIIENQDKIDIANAHNKRNFKLELANVELKKKLAEGEKDELKKLNLEKIKIQEAYNDSLKKIEKPKVKVDDSAKKKRESDEAELKKQAQAILDDIRNAAESPAERETREYNEKLIILTKNNSSTESLTKSHLEKLKNIEDKSNDDKLAAEKQYNLFIQGFKVEGNKSEQEIRDNATAKALKDNSDSGLAEISLLRKDITGKYAVKGILTKEGEEKVNEIKAQTVVNATQIQTNATTAEVKADMDKWAQRLEIATQFLNQIGSMLNQADQQNLTNIQNQNQAENTELDTKRQQELSKKGLTEAQKVAIEDKYAKLKLANDKKAFIASESIKKQQFERDKAIKLAEIVMNTAAGVMAGYKDGPIIGSALSIITLAMGALQFAAVASTSYQGGTMPTASGGAGGSVNTSNSSSTATPANQLSANKNDQNTFGAKETTNGQPMITVRAVISETEITQTQGRITKIQKSAEL